MKINNQRMPKEPNDESYRYEQKLLALKYVPVLVTKKKPEARHNNAQQSDVNLLAVINDTYGNVYCSVFDE